MIKEDSLRQLGLKYECMEHYAGGPPHCADCGTTDLRELELDHTSGGGQAERNQFSYGRGSGIYYSSLRKRGYPNNLGLQVVCSRCHRARHHLEGRGKRKHAEPAAMSEKADFSCLEQMKLWLEGSGV